MRLACLSDVEGRWEKLEGFCEGNPWVGLAGDRLVLAPGATFVFGGDAIDRGPHGRRFLRAMVAAKDAYGDRVVLLAGNRDINKLRFLRELRGRPHPSAPAGSREDILRWTLLKTMGASVAFEMRREELRRERGGDPAGDPAGGPSVSDAEVADSMLEDLAPGGALRAYLERAQLAYRADSTLFVHGAVTSENLYVVPGRGREARGGVDGWVSDLNAFMRAQWAEVERDPHGEGYHDLVAYQAPLPGTRANAQSVVYGRMATVDGDPRLPAARVRTELRAQGVDRLVVGHTPAGDTPAVLRRGGFELIALDSSYGQLERGSQVRVEGGATWTAAWSQPVGAAAPIRVEVALAPGEEPVGPGDPATPGAGPARTPVGGWSERAGLVKGTAEAGRSWLCCRFLPGFVPEDRLVAAGGSLTGAPEEP